MSTESLEAEERSSIVPVIAGMLAVASVIGVQFLPTKIMLCDPKGYCRDLDPVEYRALKDDLRQKYAENATSTFEEYQTFISVLDHEVKAKGGLNISDVRSEQDIKNAINRLLSSE